MSFDCFLGNSVDFEEHRRLLRATRFFGDRAPPTRTGADPRSGARYLDVIRRPEDETMTHPNAQWTSGGGSGARKRRPIVHPR